jgi:hypothetical protein
VSPNINKVLESLAHQQRSGDSRATNAPRVTVSGLELTVKAKAGFAMPRLLLGADGVRERGVLG